MNLNLWQQTKPVGAGNSLVMAIYKASAPSILVDHFQLPGPYTGQTQLHTFAGLQNVVYNYVCYESPDGGADGTQRNAFSIQPNQNTYQTRDGLYLIADISAFFNSGTTFYGADSSLIGWNWGIERIGQGTMHYGEHWTKTVAGVPTTQDDLTADGWKLLVSGDLVGPNERFCLHFLPQLSATSTSQASAIISQMTLLTTTTTLTNSAAGQGFLLQGGGGYFQINLPDINTVPDLEPISFNSAGGSHVNVGINCFSGQSFEWYDNQANLSGVTRSSIIYLGQCENIYIVRFTYPDGSKRWQIFGDTAGIRTVGEYIYDYSKIPLNTIFANGQVLSKTSYSRLWAWISNLEAGVVISSGFGTTSRFDNVDYAINHGKYVDLGSTFQVPIIGAGVASGTGFFRAVDGSSRHPSDFQVDGQEDLRYPTLTGKFPGQPNGKGPVQLGGGYDNTFNQSVDMTGSGGILDGSGNYVPSQKLFYENRPQNFGVYALIRV